MPKTDFEELLMVYTRLYKISQVYRVNHRRRHLQHTEPEQQEKVGGDGKEDKEDSQPLSSSSKEKQRKVYL